MKSRTNGFTLVELTVVVAIIAVIFGMAIPMLVRSRVSGNETSAIASLRTLATAQETFRAASGLERYASLPELGSSRPSYIDAALASGEVNGYTFVLNVINEGSWTATAVPTNPGKTGSRSFYIDQSMLVTFTSNGGVPTAASSVLGGPSGGTSGKVAAGANNTKKDKKKNKKNKKKDKKKNKKN